MKQYGIPSEQPIFEAALSTCLRHPCRQLQAFDLQLVEGCFIPYRVWGALSGIAVGGSLGYGATLGLHLPQWPPARSGLWLALAAGLSWCVFGPLLVLLTRCRTLTCMHACLVTMAYGEAVLSVGAAYNLAAKLKPALRPASPAKWNAALVGISNIVMATMLTQQLRTLAVPAWKPLFAWIAVLNGSGVLFFWLLRRTLQGEFK
ncbi:MAG TPA: hypothetical protein VFA10_13945 [Ktedonobacteraceae bacterium]|nr:hypothetical protein [Ktedonobacteraceae bacterium]